MNISLCLLARDEEANLAACLESVRDQVNELIVLDTGSTDRTAEIAREQGAQVFAYAWQDDFAAARNESLRHATGDWVLVLDADERLIPGVIEQIRPLLADESTLVVNLLRQEVGSQQQPYSQVSRLFRRHPELSFSRPYHELIDDSVLALQQREPHWKVVDFPNLAILHTGYQPEAIAQRQKQQRAQAALERYHQTHPDDAYVCSKLGGLYLSAGEPKQALKLLKHGLKYGQPEAPVRYELHYHLGLVQQRLGDYSEAMKHYRQAIDEPIPPVLRVGALTNLAALYREQRELQRALNCCQLAVNAAPDYAPAHYNFGMTLRAAGDLKGAIAAYRRAADLDPSVAAVHQNLGVALFQGGLIDTAREEFQRAIELYRQQGSAEGDRLTQELQTLGIKL
jgi:tetratricopeptide (TPR) repeat protein